MNETRAKDARVWERDVFDWYVEPESATDALLTVETFHGRVWDPACGGGNVLRSMRRHGVAAFGSDVVHRGVTLEEGWLGEVDFLASDHLATPNIVCNPPFFRAKGAEAFIRKALATATNKVAMFVDIKFLAGQARGAGLFRDNPPTRVWILSNRPSCPPGAMLAKGEKATGGTADWVWLVWQPWLPRGKTHLGWIVRGRAGGQDAERVDLDSGTTPDGAGNVQGGTDPG